MVGLKRAERSFEPISVEGVGPIMLFLMKQATGLPM